MPRHTPKVISCALALVIAATTTACGSAATPTVAAATPSPTEKFASVQQYAGIINSNIVDMRETMDKWNAHYCGIVDPDVTCSLLVLRLQIRAKVVVVTIDGAAKPGVPAFIGKPPAEIERLVSDTRAAAQVLDNVVPDDDPASADMTQVNYAAKRLMSVFDQWAPYI